MDWNWVLLIALPQTSCVILSILLNHPVLQLPICWMERKILLLLVLQRASYITHMMKSEHYLDLGVLSSANTKQDTTLQFGCNMSKDV